MKCRHRRTPRRPSLSWRVRKTDAAIKSLIDGALIRSWISVHADGAAQLPTHEGTQDMQPNQEGRAAMPEETKPQALSATDADRVKAAVLGAAISSALSPQDLASELVAAMALIDAAAATAPSSSSR